jgi:hypothetical protein
VKQVCDILPSARDLLNESIQLPAVPRGPQAAVLALQVKTICFFFSDATFVPSM